MVTFYPYARIYRHTRFTLMVTQGGWSTACMAGCFLPLVSIGMGRRFFYLAGVRC